MDLVINLNKPKGISSHHAVTAAKKIVHAKKAGHAGTLDPAVTGVLLVCINKATRIASYFSALDKEYEATMKLGQTTDTQDAEGSIMEQKDFSGVDESAIRNTIKSFEGEFFQQPPMYSALKHKGKPLYKYARKGLAIPVQSRKVHIHSLELLDIHLPLIFFKVNCSKGTYIRTLCHDIGEKLKVGAHLYELQRTAIGSFTIDKSIRMEELQALIPHNTGSSQLNIAGRGIYTLDNALTWMPELSISQKFVQSAKNGVPLRTKTLKNFSENLKAASGIRIKSTDNHLIAIGRYIAGKDLIKMDVVFGAFS